MCKILLGLCLKCKEVWKLMLGLSQGLRQWREMKKRDCLCCVSCKLCKWWSIRKTWESAPKKMDGKMQSQKCNHLCVFNTVHAWPVRQKKVYREVFLECMHKSFCEVPKICDKYKASLPQVDEIHMLYTCPKLQYWKLYSNYCYTTARSWLKYCYNCSMTLQ